MPGVTIVEFEFTERAASKMWDHVVEFDRLSQLLENRYVTVRNRKERTAEMVLIGHDNSG